MGEKEYEVRLHQSFSDLLQEAGQFYMAQGDVYATLRRLTRRLEQERIPYAVVGGRALAAHGFVRMTQAVDVLTSAAGLAAFRDRCVGHGYVPAFPGAQKTFRDTETQVRIEILTAGDFPGDGKPKPVSFPEPTEASVEQNGLRIVTLDKLIELKLASGISAPHRLRDLADVQDLIVTLNLPLEFAEGLDPSVRDAFRQLWQAAHTADDPPQ